MSHYVTLKITEFAFNNIIQNLELLLPKLDNYYEIEETVHLIDLLLELKNKSHVQKNEELKKDVELQQLFEQYYKDSSNIKQEDLSLFYKIQSTLVNQYGIDLDIETEFFLIMSLIHIFREENVNE